MYSWGNLDAKLSFETHLREVMSKQPRAFVSYATQEK